MRDKIKMEVKTEYTGEYKMKALLKINSRQTGHHGPCAGLRLLFAWFVWFMVVLGASCENGAFTGMIGKEAESSPLVLAGIDVKAGTLEEAFQYIKDNIEDGRSYYIDLSDYADGTFYLPPAVKRYFWGLEEMPVTSVPNCMMYPLLKGVTINIINTGGGEKTIRLKRTAQAGHEYKSDDSGSLFYIDSKVNFVIDGKINLQGIYKDAEGINNNCPLVFVSSGSFALKGGAAIKDNANINDDGDSQDPMCKGGGVYMKNSASFTMEDSLITNCSATGGGGGVYMTDTAALFMKSGAVIDGNYVTRQTGNFSGGGGVMAASADSSGRQKLIMEEDAKITNNTVSYIGTTQADTEAKSASQWGGGVYFNAYGGGSEFIMRGSAEISGNKVQGSNSQGGGVYINDQGNSSDWTAPLMCLEMYDSAKITNNTAAVYAQGSCSGGGVYINFGSMIMNGASEVSGNEAQSATGAPAKGGGVYLSYADAAVSKRNASLVMNDNSVIKENRCTALTEAAKPGIGSGVFIDGNGWFSANGKIKLLLSGSAGIPEAPVGTTAGDDNSVMVHLWKAPNNPGGEDDPELAVDPYISIGEDWNHSPILIDIAADTSSPDSVTKLSCIDIETVEHNRRRLLAMYKDDAWQENIPQNIINAFTLKRSWKIIPINTEQAVEPAQLADKWKIDSEGYLAEL